MDLFNLAVARKLSSGSGGGNPNTVKTITGTVASPWGNIDTSELYTAIANGNATAKIIIDGSAVGAGNIEAFFNARNDFIFFNGGNIGSTGEYATRVGAYVVSYNAINGELMTMDMAQNGTVASMVSYASMLPTSLTVIYHPLPT